MKSVKTGAISGCVIWVLLIGIVSSCILPIFFVIGMVTSFTDFAIQTTGEFICPEGSTPKSYSYQTTSRDEFGNSHPSTAYELHCVDSNGEVVKRDPVTYAFVWDGIFAGIGLLLAIGISFALAAPAGALVAKFLNRSKTQ
jgi:hypothetical protein